MIEVSNADVRHTRQNKRLSVYWVIATLGPLAAPGSAVLISTTSRSLCSHQVPGQMSINTSLWCILCDSCATHPKSCTLYAMLGRQFSIDLSDSTVPWWKPLTSFCLGPSASRIHWTSICRLTILGTCRACFNFGFTREACTIVMNALSRMYNCVSQHF